MTARYSLAENFTLAIYCRKVAYKWIFFEQSLFLYFMVVVAGQEESTITSVPRLQGSSKWICSSLNDNQGKFFLWKFCWPLHKTCFWLLTSSWSLNSEVTIIIFSVWHNIPALWWPSWCSAARMQEGMACDVEPRVGSFLGSRILRLTQTTLMPVCHTDVLQLDLQFARHCIFSLLCCSKISRAVAWRAA